MDVQMPVMDGFEATKRIIAEYADKRPRIVAMTARGLQGDAEECRRAGMDDYVAKPVRLTDLQAVLKRQPCRASSAEDPMGNLRQLEAEAGTDLVHELIDLYLKDAPARIAAMKAALASRDAKALQLEAHTLKSSSATLGGQATANACQIVELSARDQAFEQAAAALPVVEAMFQAFTPILVQERAHA
jgi:CheY-like chemotaxis protein